MIVRIIINNKSGTMFQLLALKSIFLSGNVECVHSSTKESCRSLSEHGILLLKEFSFIEFLLLS